MTLGDIQNKIYSLTGTDSTSYPNSTMLIDLNVWYQKIVSMIFDSEDETDWDDPHQSTYPIFKTLLTTNRDIQIPTNLKVLKIKSISVSYDGNNVYRASPFDIGELNLPVVNAANTNANLQLDGYFSKTDPKFDIKYGSIWLYPIATSSDVANGAYMMSEFFREPIEFTATDLTTGTLIPGIDTTFHGMLAYGPAFEYANAKQLPQLKLILAQLQDFETRLRRQYSSKQVDRRYQLVGDYQTYK